MIGSPRKRDFQSLEPVETIGRKGAVMATKVLIVDDYGAMRALVRRIKGDDEAED